MSYSLGKNGYEYTEEFERNKNRMEDGMPPPPQPPPLPASVQFPILYEVITQEETKKDQDINGNVVSLSSSSTSNYNNTSRQRPRIKQEQAEVVGSSGGLGDDDGGVVCYTGEGSRQRAKLSKQEAHSVVYIPTWLFYFRNEYLVSGSPLFQDAEVSPEAEDPILNSKISFWYGDIRNLEVDAIVNSTTSHFDGRNGVDRDIHYGAGAELTEKCRQLTPCEIGDIRVTQGFKLPAKYIIHTVAPTDSNSESLQSCYTRSLIFLRHQGLKTIAFPCIGTGFKGFPRVEAARIALSSVRVFLEVEKDDIDRIIFCVHNKPNQMIYLRFLQTYFPSTL